MQISRLFLGSQACFLKLKNILLETDEFPYLIDAHNCVGLLSAPHCRCLSDQWHRRA